MKTPSNFPVAVFLKSWCDVRLRCSSQTFQSPKSTPLTDETALSILPFGTPTCDAVRICTWCPWWIDMNCVQILIAFLSGWDSGQTMSCPRYVSLLSTIAARGVKGLQSVPGSKKGPSVVQDGIFNGQREVPNRFYSFWVVDCRRLDGNWQWCKWHKLIHSLSRSLSFQALINLCTTKKRLGGHAA